jgi:antitoxin VapB
MGILNHPGKLPTRIFKSGNSLSVRIPKEMVPPEVPQDAEIEYKDGVWTIRPVQGRKLTGLGAKFRAFSPEFMAQGRQPEPEVERDWPDRAVKPTSGQRKRKA